MKAGRCFLAAVAVLALFNVARSLGLLGPSGYAWAPVSLLTVILALIAWTTGAARADLGLDPADLRAGLRYGAGAVGIVLLVLIVASALPATSGFLHDARARISGGRLLYELGVSILLLTAIPEEFAFRGVLLGSALRLWGPWRASLVTSALFGLWQIGGDLPEGHEGNPEHALEHVLAGGLADPVGLAEDQVRAPPDDRVGRVHHVQDPAGRPGLAIRRYVRTRIVREPHDPPVMIDG